MSTDRVPELDWLRFGAASAVLIYHNTYRVPVRGIPSEEVFPAIQLFSQYGYLGVNLFFLISGFVILWSAGSKTVRQFAMGRMLRLYPTFWAAMALTLVVMFLLEPNDRRPESDDVLANLTMLPALVGREAIDGVYWTLTAEMKFYALLAAAIAFKQIPRIELWLWAWLFLLAVCNAGVDIPFVGSLTLFPFGSLFAGGSWAFLIRSRGASRSRLSGFATSMILSVYAVGEQSDDFMHDVQPREILVSRIVVGACFIIMLCISMSWWRTRHAGIAASLGALTYPLYLVHNRIGKALSASTEGVLPIGVRILLVSLVALILAVLLVIVVERRLLPALARTRIYRRLAGSKAA